MSREFGSGPPEAELLETEEFDKRQVEVGKETIEYMDRPAAEKKEGQKEKAIFLMPGFGSTVETTEEVFTQLRKYFPEARIISYTPLGMEGSSTPEDRSLKYSVGVTQEFLKKIGVRKEKSDLTVVTHSKADLEGLKLAVAEPELVRNLVLVNPAFDFRKLYKLGILALEKIPLQARKYPLQAFRLGWRFLKGIAPRGLLYQVSSVGWGEKINWQSLLKNLKANLLVIGATEDITPYELPPSFKKKNLEHRLVAGMGHHWLFYEPEALALTLESWLKNK